MNDLFTSYKRGDIVWAIDRESASGKCVQKGNRPLLVLQNDVGNLFALTLIVAPITSKLKKEDLPTHVKINGFPLDKPSIIQLEQLKTIDKSDIAKYQGALTYAQMLEVDKALGVSIGLRKIDSATAKELIRDMSRNMLKHTLQDIEPYLLKELVKELNLFTEEELKTTAVHTETFYQNTLTNSSVVAPIAQNLEFGELQPLSMVLQGRVAQYSIDERVSIRLNEGKIDEDALHILIKELERVEKLIKKEE